MKVLLISLVAVSHEWSRNFRGLKKHVAKSNGAGFGSMGQSASGQPSARCIVISDFITIFARMREMPNKARVFSRPRRSIFLAISVSLLPTLRISYFSIYDNVALNQLWKKRKKKFIKFHLFHFIFYQFIFLWINSIFLGWN